MYPFPEPGRSQTAFEVLLDVLAQHGARYPERHLGDIRWLDHGLTYDAWFADADMGGDEPVRLVVRLPHRYARAGHRDRARVELEVLHWLGMQSELPFRIPRLLGTVEVDEGTAMVQEMVWGLPARERTVPRPYKPWQPSALVAAAVHSLDASLVQRHLPGRPTWRDSALDGLRWVRQVDLVEADEAYHWGLEHLPPARPSVFLHGDLLGQNLLIPVDEDAEEDPRIGVVDWEEARMGDPGYELHVVTRGKKQPFNQRDGHRRLIDAYLEAGGLPVELAHLHIHELALIACEVLDADQPGVLKTRIEQFQALWKRVLKASSQSAAA